MAHRHARPHLSGRRQGAVFRSGKQCADNNLPSGARRERKFALSCPLIRSYPSRSALSRHGFSRVAGAQSVAETSLGAKVRAGAPKDAETGSFRWAPMAELYADRKAPTEKAELAQALLAKRRGGRQMPVSYGLAPTPGRFAVGKELCARLFALAPCANGRISTSASFTSERVWRNLAVSACRLSCFLPSPAFPPPNSASPRNNGCAGESRRPERSGTGWISDSRNGARAAVQ